MKIAFVSSASEPGGAERSLVDLLVSLRRHDPSLRLWLIGNGDGGVARMARDAGAKKVYMASAAPPVRFPNVYGIDMPTKEELIAHGRTSEEVRAFIGADALVYQDVEAMKRVVGALNPAVEGFEASCFDGEYVTGDVSASDFERWVDPRAMLGPIP